MSKTNGPVLISQPAKLPHSSFSDVGAVKQPIGSPVPHIKRIGFEGEGLEKYRFGVWEATVGKYRRDVTDAEYCFFLSGKVAFTLDDGRSWTFGANDAVFFPADCLGIWDISEPLRKAFVVIPA